MQTIPLWTDAAPGALGTAPQDIPSLDIYEPYGSEFSGAAMLVFPGGGYGVLAPHEGEGYAGLFRLSGFKVFVCKYRLGPDGYRHPIMLNDAARAVRVLRSRAEEFGIDPEKIVVIGSSAGGHLAATLLTQWDHGQPDHLDPIQRVSSRPSAGILCYPVITMLEKTHGGSRTELLGPNPSEELVRQLSAELNVRSNTPPCFIWHTVKDDAVPVHNSLDFARALLDAGVDFELHCYERGRHGLGMNDRLPWMQECLRWLKEKLS